MSSIKSNLKEKQKTVTMELNYDKESVNITNSVCKPTFTICE